MQDSGNDNPITPLTPDEFEATWQKFFVEVDQTILLTVGKMGFSRSLKRTIEKLTSRGQYVPTCEQLQFALTNELGLHTRILENIRDSFQRAVFKGKVDRSHAGGWLYKATRRKTWKLAIPRARQLLFELHPCVAGTDELANIGSSEWSPDELLILREFSEQYAQVTATLSIEERQLLDAKIAGKGYSNLAAAKRTTENAIKTKVSRLCQRIARLVQADNGTKTRKNDEENGSRP